MPMRRWIGVALAECLGLARNLTQHSQRPPCPKHRNYGVGLMTARLADDALRGRGAGLTTISKPSAGRPWLTQAPHRQSHWARSLGCDSHRSRRRVLDLLLNKDPPCRLPHALSMSFTMVDHHCVEATRRHLGTCPRLGWCIRGRRASSPTSWGSLDVAGCCCGARLSQCCC